MRQTYAVFVGSKWGRFSNKRDAIRSAKKVHGIVRSMSLFAGDGAWDAPTFWACSVVVADFRTN